MLLLVACNLPEVQECRAEKENSLQAWLPHACICIHLFHEKAFVMRLLLSAQKWFETDSFKRVRTTTGRRKVLVRCRTSHNIYIYS